MTVSFFADLSIVIAVAGAVVLIFSRFNLPLTVGYILAGIIVGPNVPPALISNKEHIQMLSDLGVMFLMFSIGLGFSFRRVRSMGSTILFPAFWDVIWMLGGGFILARMLGWSPLEGFLLGLILCDSSTSIAAKTFEELGWVSRRFAGNTFGIALIEDVLAILLIAVFHGITGSADEAASLWDTAQVIGKQLGILALFLVGSVVFGILLIPKLMNHVTERFSDEIVVMVALAICFAISCLAQEGLELSLVVGAFLAGTVIAEARARRRIERVVRPISTLFGAVFFISVGLMVDVYVLWAYAPVVLLLTVVLIFLKLGNNFFACILMGEQPRDAFKVGIAMGQVAEFSFIIAGIAIVGGLTERPVYQIAVGIALLCTATNPYLLKYSDAIYDRCAKLTGPSGAAFIDAFLQWRANLVARSQKGGPSALAEIRSRVMLIAINLAIVTILFIGVYLAFKIPFIHQSLVQADALFERWGIAIHVSGIIGLLVALLLSAMPLWAAQHNWSDLARYIARETFDGLRIGVTRVRRFVQSVLRIAGWISVSLYVVLLSTTFVANLWVVGIVIVILAMVMVRHSKHFRREYMSSHAILLQAFDVEHERDEPDEPLEALLHVHSERIRIPATSASCGKTLAQLDLRKRTGVTVVSVRGRSGTQIAVGGNTILHAGDELVLMGTDEHLAAAMRELCEA